jgi:hypothetical protein
MVAVWADDNEVKCWCWEPFSEWIEHHCGGVAGMNHLAFESKFDASTSDS